MAAIDYYNNEDQWGNYQYITIEDIVNTYMLSRTNDDYTNIIPRHQILLQAKRGLRELYYDVVREIRMVELDISPALTVTVPPDFVNMVRISWVDENGRLHPMAYDGRMNIASAYLQDHQYGFLYDAEGCVLIGSGVRDSTIEREYSPDESELFQQYYFDDSNFIPNYNLSQIFENGAYRFDRSRGVYEFGTSVLGKTIVLEYISDGLFTGCEGLPESQIRVHKFAEAALLDFIYHELIARMRNVPDYEKRRAKKSYGNNKRLAKRRINTIRIDELNQIFKGQTKWIKGS